MSHDLTPCQANGYPDAIEEQYVSKLFAVSDDGLDRLGVKGIVGLRVEYCVEVPRLVHDERAESRSVSRSSGTRVLNPFVCVVLCFGLR